MRPSGYTLTEVLLGLILVVGIFFALASILPVAMQGTRKSETSTIASNLAHQYLDWWMNRDYAQVKTMALTAPASVTYFDPLTGPTPSSPSPQQYGSFVLPQSDTAYTSVVQFQLNPSDPNLCNIDVQVTWLAGGPAAALSGARSLVHYQSEVFNTVDPW